MPEVKSVIGELEYRYGSLARVGIRGAIDMYTAERRDTGSSQRSIAIEVMHSSAPDDPSFAAFVGQYAMLAKISHRNILPILDLITAPDGAAIVLPGPFEHALGGPDVAPRQRIEPVRQILSALEQLHGEGVVHRNINPLAVVFDGNFWRLTGFEVVQRVEADGKCRSETFGSPAYLTPEYLGRGGYTDRRSDVYATGVLSYELLCGRRPFPGSSFTDLNQAFEGRASFPRPVEVDSTIPAALDDLVMRCVEFDPAQRVQSIRELREILESILGAPAPPADTAPDAVSRESRKRPAAAPRRRYGSFRVSAELGGDAVIPSFKADKRGPKRGDPRVAAVVRSLDGVEPAAAREFLEELEAKNLAGCPGAAAILEATPSDLVGVRPKRRAFVAREFVQGVPIGSLAPLPCDAVSTDRVLHMLWLVAGVLDCAAPFNAVHGALHEDNVLLTPPGDDVTVVDWFVGLARKQAPAVVGATRDVRVLTRHSAYTPPEELVTGRSTSVGDIFRVGVLAHQLLVGYPPHRTPDARAVDTDLAAHQWAVSGQRVALPGIRRDISDLVIRALAQDHRARFQTPAELRGAIGELLHVTPCTLTSSTGTQFTIKDPQAVIGRRDPETGFVPPIDLTDEEPADSPTVSRRHARLRFIDGHWLLTQEPTMRNWTMVNDELLASDGHMSVANGYPLQPGAVLGLTRVTLTFAT